MTWTDHAACAGRSELMHDRVRSPEALALCAACPVLDDCRADVARSPWKPVNCTQAGATWWPATPPRVCPDCGADFWRTGGGRRCPACITAAATRPERRCGCCRRMFAGRPDRRYCCPACQNRAAYRRRAGLPEADHDQEVPASG